METTVLEFDTNDLLVSEEAKWVRAHKPVLMQVWRALRKINHDIAPEQMYLDEANFSIFASFVYRWTDTDYSYNTDSNGDGDESGDTEEEPNDTSPT